MPDQVTGWLARFAAALRVHGGRRRRILDEARAHLAESAARHGAAEAVRRMGDPDAVAAGFAPRLADRLWEQRDRLAALVLLAATAASLSIAVTLARDARDSGSWAFLAFFAVLAPAAGLAVMSAGAVLLGRPLGRRLLRPFAIAVAAAALVAAVPLPPAAGTFAAYRSAVRAGHDSAGCAGRSLAACADDHAAELRGFNTFGAVTLTVVYLVCVSGWTPRRPRRQDAEAIAS